jgi:PAS domain S-box-containing protein
MTIQNIELQDLAQADRLYADELMRLRLLLEASSTLLGSLSVEAMLPEILDLSRRTLAADAYAMWQYDEPRDSWSIATHSGLSGTYVASAERAVQGHPTAVSLEEPIVAEDIADTEWLLPTLRAAHAAEGNRSMLAVALRYGDRVLGTLAFYYREPHLFTVSEKNAASLLANLAAAAIGAAELYQRQQRAAEDQRFIAEASELLGSSLEFETTLAHLASLAIPRFADWCSIDMAEPDGSIRRLAVAHVDMDKSRSANELAEKYPPDPSGAYGVPNVIRTGKAELFAEIPDDLLRGATRDTPELYELLRELGLKSSMCVPLIARNRIFGAITFVSGASGRRYGEDDLATAQDLARRAAMAVDNALLFREAESARTSAQESLAVVDAVFAAAPIGLAFMDSKLHFVRVNDALAKINGLPPNEHYGRSLRDVLGDQLADEIEPLHRRVLETGEPIIDMQIEGRARRATGSSATTRFGTSPTRSSASASSSPTSRRGSARAVLRRLRAPDSRCWQRRASVWHRRSTTRRRSRISHQSSCRGSRTGTPWTSSTTTGRSGDLRSSTATRSRPNASRSHTGCIRRFRTSPKARAAPSERAKCCSTGGSRTTYSRGQRGPPSVTRRCAS